MTTEKSPFAPVDEEENAPVEKSPAMRNALLVIAVILIAGVVYFLVNRTSDPQQQAQIEAKDIVAAVAKLMVLPSDEQPIIATVADPTKLEGQPFFANAKIGDKVLIFNSAHKAVLFRPDDNRIVDVAPLSIGKATFAPK